MKKGFDNELYFKEQLRAIKKRRAMFKHKFYLELGGKVVYDGHAKRVLPGYDPRVKLRILKSIRNYGVIYCVNAKQLQSKQRLQDTELTYKKQALKEVRELEKNNLKPEAIIITRFSGEKKAIEFKNFLEKKHYKVLVFFEIKNYFNIKKLLSEKGYGAQPYFTSKKKMILVTGTASGSGKMGFILSQLYHEFKKSKLSGYAKFETFPVWNLPLNHPINLAYEAATADLGDENKIDALYLRYYGVKAVNYNRDIHNFKILKTLVKKFALINNHMRNYHSPTDMGINTISKCIIDEGVVRRAALKEIRRRYKIYLREYEKGFEKKKTIERMKKIMKKAGLKIKKRMNMS